VVVSYLLLVHWHSKAGMRQQSWREGTSSSLQMESDSDCKGNGWSAGGDVMGEDWSAGRNDL
jgi:hypothetical protein